MLKSNLILMRIYMYKGVNKTTWKFTQSIRNFA